MLKAYILCLILWYFVGGKVVKVAKDGKWIQLLVGKDVLNRVELFRAGLEGA